ncbi:hypothetical protein Tco_1245441 [Tanacetum coccineum]
MFHRPLILLQIVQLILFIVDSGCTKHMTGNLKLLCNFVEKFLGTVRFGNDQFAPILGIYLFCEMIFRETSTNWYSWDLILYANISSRNNFINSIYLRAKASPTQCRFMASKASHLNFDYITFLSKKEVVNGLPKLKYVKDQLCSSCEMSKAKRSSFKTKAVPSSKGRLNLLHMDLCGPMRVARHKWEKLNLGDC